MKNRKSWLDILEILGGLILFAGYLFEMYILTLMVYYSNQRGM